MQKSLHIDPPAHSAACSAKWPAHYEHTGTINPSKSRIKVFSFEHEGRKVPHTCTQCSDAWCLNACPVDAIVASTCRHRRQGGRRSCVGCKGVPIACPFGTINYMADVGKVQNATCAAATPPAPRPARRGDHPIDAEWTGSTACAPWAAKATCRRGLRRKNHGMES